MALLDDSINKRGKYNPVEITSCTKIQFFKFLKPKLTFVLPFAGFVTVKILLLYLACFLTLF